MKLVVLQENLLDTFTLASKFLTSKTATLPTINNFLLKAEKETITLFATDLETSLIRTVPGKIEADGEVLLPAQTLVSLLSLYKGGKIIIEEKEGKVEIKTPNSSASIKTQNPNDFPRFTVKKTLIFQPIETELFGQIVKKVAFSSSGDQTRAELTGLLFQGKEKEIVVVATDGFRLSRLILKKPGSLWERGPIVPVKAVRLLFDLVKGEKEVQAAIDEEQNTAVFKMENGFFATRFVQGSFPPYEKILPTSATTTVVLPREELLRAVRLAAVFAKDASNIVRLDFKEDKATIEANSPQTGKNTTTLSVSKEGDDVTVAFNYRFLLDVLSSCDSDELVFETNGPLHPGAFTIKNNTSFLHVIMPVRLQESN